jgi:hypothetical protein
MTKLYAIYALHDPRTGDIRYIGKALRLTTRYNMHMNGYDRQCASQKWITSLKAIGLSPYVSLLEAVEAGRECEAEIKWIAHHKALGAKLLNHTIGGEGCYGRVLSQESRMKISNSLKGRKNGPCSPSRREAIRNSKVARYSTLNQEEKKKLITRLRTPEARAKARNSLLGHPVSQATRDKIRQANKKRWESKICH